MSVDLITKAKSGQKTYRKHKEGLEGKNKNKRKREEPPDHGPSPTKKHRSSKRPKPTAISSQNTIPSDLVVDSPFHLQTSSLYLPIAPISQLHPIDGLCAEYLSPLILTYYPPFRGVVLSFSNVRLSESPDSHSKNSGLVLARSIDEYGATYVWITADFLLLKPQSAGWIEGWVNLQNEGHLGLVCWNLFNASIDRKELPSSWRWVNGGKETGFQSTNGNGIVHSQVHSSQETEGYFVDELEDKVTGKVKFRVKDLETSPSTDRERGFVSIEGTMLNEEHEEDLLEAERAVFDEAAPTREVGEPSSRAGIDLTVNGSDDKTNNDRNGKSRRKRHRIAY